MHRRLLLQKVEDAQREEQRDIEAPENVFERIFDDSAWKVWRAAEHQHPEAAQQVGRALTTLLETGKLTEKVNDGQLLWLFKRLGLRVRFDTKIRILEGGKLKSIADKLSER